MPDAAPESFPTYQPPTIAKVPLAQPHPKAGKPLFKLMTRALRGRKGQSIFSPKHIKRKKPRIV